MLVWAVSAQAGSRPDPMADFGVITPKVRMAAPAFSLPDLAGGRASLADYRGKVVMLHFWATWCLPCRAEVPKLHRLWNHFRSRGLEVVCVNVDRGGPEGVQAFMRETDAHFSTLLDPGGRVRSLYEVRGLPTTYLIGRDGRITGRIIGERDWTGEKAGAMIDALLQREANSDSASSLHRQRGLK